MILTALKVITVQFFSNVHFRLGKSVINDHSKVKGHLGILKMDGYQASNIPMETRGYSK